MGHLTIRSGEKEISFKEMIATLGPYTRHEIFPSYEWKEPGWLEPFVEHEAFWEEAIDTGHVDVIYRPDPSFAEMHPGYKKMIGLPLIFKNVPITTMDPEKADYGQGLEWYYNRTFDYKNRVDTPCGLLKE